MVRRQSRHVLDRYVCSYDSTKRIKKEYSRENIAAGARLKVRLKREQQRNGRWRTVSAPHAGLILVKWNEIGASQKMKCYVKHQVGHTLTKKDIVTEDGWLEAQNIEEAHQGR